MAYVIGYATDVEVATLRRRGWDVEMADDYGLVAPRDEPERAPKHQIVGPPPDGKRAVFVYVDPSVFDVLSGPDWEHDEHSDPLYWSNDQGWVDRDSCDVFDQTERDTLRLPVGGTWETNGDIWIIREVRP